MHKTWGRFLCLTVKAHENKDKDGNRSMEKPVLVIMAAGMGSRYGGLKQIDPVLRRSFS